MGETETPGVFVASGHFRNGILLAPVTGELITDVLTGARPRISLEPYRSDRFARGSV